MAEKLTSKEFTPSPDGAPLDEALEDGDDDIDVPGEVGGVEEVFDDGLLLPQPASTSALALTTATIPPMRRPRPAL